MTACISNVGFFWWHSIILLEAFNVVNVDDAAIFIIVKCYYFLIDSCRIIYCFISFLYYFSLDVTVCFVLISFYLILYLIYKRYFMYIFSSFFSIFILNYFYSESIMSNLFILILFLNGIEFGHFL